MATTNTTNMLFSIPPPAQNDDTHKTYAVSIAIIVLSFFTCIFVAVRLTHRFRTKTVGLDDYAMILALIFYIGWTFLAVYLILGAGIGKPLTEITLDEYAFWFKGLLACTWMYPWSSACIRLSIIFFYRRVFFKGSGWILRWGLWTMLGLQAVYVIVFSILPAFTCQPFHYAWILQERNAHCNLLYWYQNLEGLYAASLALDGLLLLFPMVPIAKLQMPLKKRLGVGFVFALGFS
ncbi:hypothetical protein VSDG_06094 [Cytospora chrysosperma]|uniref:Rhodopsin domain-containing protein n=1 Tax=Cytospora chrysosperma TaxID=252740 RepID=A0A423VWD3_CYTCH|nr:hypothetical protein VSDG_06094 [Valsa sordida]